MGDGLSALPDYLLLLTMNSFIPPFMRCKSDATHANRSLRQTLPKLTFCDLFLERLVLATVHMNVWFSQGAAVSEILPLQQHSRCERTQLERAMAGLGSLPPSEQPQHLFVRPRSRRCGRPKPAIHQVRRRRNAASPNRTFASSAKASGGRTHRPRDKVSFRCNGPEGSFRHLAYTE